MKKPWPHRIFGLLMTPLLVLASCVETTVLQTTPTGPNALPPADPAAVTSIEVFPSSARFVNGATFTFTVVTRVGGVEALAVFVPSVEDISIASVLGADQSERTVLVRARGVGETELVVRSGDVQASAAIRVTPASP